MFIFKAKVLKSFQDSHDSVPCDAELQNDQAGNSSDKQDISSTHLAVSSHTEACKPITRQTYALLLVIQAWFCFLSNGFLPTVQVI